MADELLLKIRAEAQQAVSELGKIRAEMAELTGVARQQLTVLEKLGEDGAKGFRKHGAAARESANIIRESYTTIVSEVIESWGVDGDIANELAKMFYKMPVVAQAGLAGVIAAFVAAGVAAAALIATTAKMIDVSKDVGTKSKEDFDKLAKAAKEAGVEITNTDRALAQQLNRSIEQAKSAFDGLFLEILRTSGPALIVLLDAVKESLNDLKPEAQGVGEVLTDAFLGSAAALRTFILGLKTVENIFQNPTALLSGFSAFTAGLIQNFLDEFDKLQKKAEQTKPTKITNESKGKDNSGQDAVRALQEQLRDELDALEAFRASVKREYDQRELDESLYTGVLIEAEKERLAIILDNLKKQEEAATGKLKGRDLTQERARIAREQANAQRGYAEALERIDDESAKRREQLGIQREQAILQRAQAALSRQLATIKDAEDQRIISHEEAEEQIAAVIERGFELRKALAQVEVDNARNNTELKAAATAKLVALEIAEAAAAEESARRKRDARRRDIEESINLGIAQRESQVRNLQQEGFDQSTARAVAEIEAALGRPLTLIETVRIALKQLTLDTQKEVPKIGAVFSQMNKAIGPSLNASIAAFTAGRATIRQAAAAFYSAALQPLVDYLNKKAVAQFAQGVEDLANLNFPGAALHFAAGAALSAAAGFVGGGVSGLIAGNPSSASGGALGNAVTGTRQDDSTRSTEERFRFTERNGAGVAMNNLIITIKTDQAQQVANVERALVTSYRQEGAAKQIIDDRVSGTGLTTG